MHEEIILKHSESGKILQLLAPNGRTILEILIHGDILGPINSAINNLPIVKGRSNIFRGECFQLANWELLDLENERVIEK